MMNLKSFLRNLIMINLRVINFLMINVKIKTVFNNNNNNNNNNKTLMVYVITHY